MGWQAVFVHYILRTLTPLPRARPNSELAAVVVTVVMLMVVAEVASPDKTVLLHDSMYRNVTILLDEYISYAIRWVCDFTNHEWTSRNNLII